MLTRHSRSSERGQTLILAIAFLAMFGIFAASVLAFASGVQIQRGLTEKTASIDSVLEGSAQFAIADTGVQGCGTVTSGTMHFASGDNLSYAAGAGASACFSSVTTTSGQDCGLCVLDTATCPPPSPASACTGTPIDVSSGSWKVPGEIDVNGSINIPTICSGTCPAGTGGVIGLYGTAATCKTSCASARLASLPNQVLDPLANALPVPGTGNNKGARSGTQIICPGTYSDLSASANGNILFLAPYGTNNCIAPFAGAPSLYVITGSISIKGGGNLVASGSTLYLAPTASFTTGGSGLFSIDCGATSISAVCGTEDTPTAGPYAGVAIFIDPLNTPTAVAGCQKGLAFDGTGDFRVAGTFEASHAIMNMCGTPGNQSIQAGRLIISAMKGHGQGGADLGFGGTVASATGCNFWTDSLPVTFGDGSQQTAHVRFETACNTGTPTSIIGFAHQ